MTIAMEHFSGVAYCILPPEALRNLSPLARARYCKNLRTNYYTVRRNDTNRSESWLWFTANRRPLSMSSLDWLRARGVDWDTVPDVSMPEELRIRLDAISVPRGRLQKSVLKKRKPATKKRYPVMAIERRISESVIEASGESEEPVSELIFFSILIVNYYFGILCRHHSCSCFQESPLDHFLKRPTQS